MQQASEFIGKQEVIALGGGKSFPEQGALTCLAGSPQETTGFQRELDYSFIHDNLNILFKLSCQIKCLGNIFDRCC